MNQPTNMGELQSRLAPYPGLTALLNFVVERMMLFPFDTRYAQMVQELDQLSCQVDKFGNAE